MADDADSKSVVGNHVWVQVPLPALVKKESISKYALFSFLLADIISEYKKVSRTSLWCEAFLTPFYIQIKSKQAGMNKYVPAVRHITKKREKGVNR